MDDLWQPTSGLLIAVVTAATAWINHKLKDLDRQVNNKGLHGRKESLYELVHKNDIIAEQQLGMLKMIDEKLDNTDQLCKQTSEELYSLIESRKADWENVHQRFDKIKNRITAIEDQLTN